MQNKQIYFVESDRKYASAIERYIVNNHGHINVTFIFEIAELVQILEENKYGVELLIISESMYTKELKNFSIQKIALLTESVSNEEDDSLAIYKYQSGERILAEITSLLEDQANKLARMSGRTQVVGIYSPIGGAGKSTIAATLSILAAYREKRVLYLNLENVPSTNNYFEVSDGGNFSRLIYYLRKKKRVVQDRILKVQQLDSKYSVYFFAPTDNVDDLLSMSTDEYKLLLESICKTEQFDYVFVDFSSELSSKKKEMLNACDKVLLILSHDENCLSKVEIFEKEIELSVLAGSLKERIIVVLNKYFSEYTMKIEKENIFGKEIDYKIPYDEALKHRSGRGFVLDTSNSMQKTIFEMLTDL